MSRSPKRKIKKHREDSYFRQTELKVVVIFTNSDPPNSRVSSVSSSNYIVLRIYIRGHLDAIPVRITPPLFFYIVTRVYSTIQ
jgi:hypothetical protein